MKFINLVRRPYVILPALAALLLIGFQNCQPAIFGNGDNNSDNNNVLSVCQGISCSLAPITTQPAVSTILLALGDELDSQLIVNHASAQLIAETVVRYSTPVNDPKILIVHDSNSGSESPEDLSYVLTTLLSRYDVAEMDEPAGGLKPSDVAGYDLIWFNNPGYPMGSSVSRDTLIGFAGGVILQGDDLSQGNGFSIEALTGLHYVDNGVNITCDNPDGDGSQQSYYTDNNGGLQFAVSLDGTQFTGVDTSTLSFKYGNDIDLTTPARSDLQIIATAKGDMDSCHDKRPAIVRYLKPAPAQSSPDIAL